MRERGAGLVHEGGQLGYVPGSRAQSWAALRSAAMGTNQTDPATLIPAARASFAQGTLAAARVTCLRRKGACELTVAGWGGATKPFGIAILILPLRPRFRRRSGCPGFPLIRGSWFKSTYRAGPGALTAQSGSWPFRH